MSPLRYIMLFSIPLYAGANGNLADAFKILCFVLFLPVVTYSATPLYRSAWGALKVRQLSADSALVIALWVGFVASTINLIRGSGGIYFDSSAGFLFLILISRWFLQASQRRWLRGPLSDLPWEHEIVRCIGDNGHSRILAKDLKPEMVFELKENQVVPVDCVLEASHGLFDTSWMTGEASPTVLPAGMKVSAGYRCLSSRSAFRASSSIATSELAKSLRRIESNSIGTDCTKLNHRTGVIVITDLHQAIMLSVI